MTGYDFSDLKIVVCDDSFHMRELVRTFLEGFGIKNVLAASDAEGAYEVICEHDPDLVITDWNMVPLTGIELVRQVRLDALPILSCRLSC